MLHGLLVALAVVGFSTHALGQGSDSLRLDLTQLRNGTLEFRMLYKDSVAGSSAFHTRRDADSLVLTETSVLARFGVDAVNVATIDAATLRPRAFRATGTMFGRPVDITAAFADGRVDGTSVFPRAGSAAGESMLLSAAIDGTTFERSSVFFLAPALPLHDGATNRFRWYNTYDGSIAEITMRVEGRESVVVPAGRFETWRVALEGGSPSQVLWITQSTPRHIVRIQVTGQPWVYELLRRVPDSD